MYLSPVKSFFKENVNTPICKYECISVYTDVFNHTFLSREIKSHISEMDNVKVKETLFTCVFMSSRFELKGSIYLQYTPYQWMLKCPLFLFQLNQLNLFDDVCCCTYTFLSVKYESSLYQTNVCHHYYQMSATAG